MRYNRKRFFFLNSVLFSICLSLRRSLPSFRKVFFYSGKSIKRWECNGDKAAGCRCHWCCLFIGSVIIHRLSVLCVSSKCGVDTPFFFGLECYRTISVSKLQGTYRIHSVTKRNKESMRVGEREIYHTLTRAEERYFLVNKGESMCWRCAHISRLKSLRLTSVDLDHRCRTSFGARSSVRSK